jgi:hypothetical protein
LITQPIFSLYSCSQSYIWLIIFLYKSSETFMTHAGSIYHSGFCSQHICLTFWHRNFTFKF